MQWKRKDVERELANLSDTTDKPTSLILERTSAKTPARGQIKARDNFFKTLFEEAPFGIVMAGPDYRFWRVNSAICRLLGYSEKELLGKTFYDITHPDDLNKSQVVVQRLISSHNPVKYVKRFLRK